MSRVPTPPPPGEMSSGPVAESWCYTQVICMNSSDLHREQSRVSQLITITVGPPVKLKKTMTFPTLAVILPTEHEQVIVHIFLYIHIHEDMHIGTGMAAQGGGGVANCLAVIFSEDLGNLWETTRFTDCSFYVGGQEFKAHKSVLAARSPVFNAMFEHEMEESKKNRVEINDVDPEVFKEMMRFIYTGKAPNLEKMADNLLAAADKTIWRFLRKCSNGSLGSVAKLFVPNYEFILCPCCVTVLNAFVFSQATDIMETAGWKSMIHSHPHLVAEAFRALASAQCPQFGIPRKRLKQS
uniref:BTB domain-containing protein n=1 Tax=Pavo cristatus TaxID=9049 RepID=A0A8C9LCE3_PAVCR